MSLSRPSIEAVWTRIKRFEGSKFETKTGKEFTYSVSGESLRPSRAKQNITRSDFAKALELAPLDGPGEIGELVRGSAYVWAVLHDRRIRESDW